MLTSPARRARVPGTAVDERLRPWDLGRWAGQHVHDLPPDELAAWRHDPEWDGHGGESLQAVVDRVTGLLEQWRGLDGRLVVITHASTVRAAVLIALRAPGTSAWDLDIRPGSRTELHGSGSGWRVSFVGCTA